MSDSEQSNSLVNPLALIALIRESLEQIIGNELPPSIWQTVDAYFNGLAAGYRS